MSKGLRVMVVEPDKEPYEKMLKHSLEAMQEVVGGYIETTRDSLLPGMILVVNEEGKIKGLPMNRSTHCDIICGTFFVCANGRDDFRSLSDEQVEEVKLVYGLPKGDSSSEQLDEIIIYLEMVLTGFNTFIEQLESTITPSVSSADSSLKEGAEKNPHNSGN